MLHWMREAAQSPTRPRQQGNTWNRVRLWALHRSSSLNSLTGKAPLPPAPLSPETAAHLQHLRKRGPLGWCSYWQIISKRNIISFSRALVPPRTASSLEDLADLKNIRTEKQGWLTSAPVTHQGENLFKILFQFVFLNRGVLKSAGRHLIDFNEARGSSWELLFGMNAAFIRSHWKPARFLLNAT